MWGSAFGGLPSKVWTTFAHPRNPLRAPGIWALSSARDVREASAWMDVVRSG